MSHTVNTFKDVCIVMIRRYIPVALLEGFPALTGVDLTVDAGEIVLVKAEWFGLSNTVIISFIVIVSPFLPIIKSYFDATDFLALLII